MAGVTVKYCPNCARNKIEHEFQDRQGKYIRVMNLKADDKSTVCTVCGDGGKKK